MTVPFYDDPDLITTKPLPPAKYKDPAVLAAASAPYVGPTYADLYKEVQEELEQTRTHVVAVGPACVLQANLSMPVLSQEDEWVPSAQMTTAEIELLDAINNPVDAQTPKEQVPAWWFAQMHDQHRCHASVDTFDALILDFDKDVNWPPVEAEQETQYTPYDWYWHTTSSHTAARWAWRMIMPLAEPVAASVIFGPDFRTLAKQIWTYCDPSSLSNVQKVPHDSWDYGCGYHAGKRWSLAEVQDKLVEVALQRKARLQANRHYEGVASTGDINRARSAAIAKVKRMLDAIPQHQCGYRYTKLCQAAGTAIGASIKGMPLINDDDVMTLITAHTDDMRVRNMITQFLRTRQSKTQG